MKKTMMTYRFRLTAFKKNDRNLELTISAPSIIEAWAEARLRSFGFPYYLESIQKPNKKAAPSVDCLKAQT